MKKSYLLICAALLSVSVAAATDLPKMETFLGYDFARFDPNSPFVPSFNANGGSGQFVYNVRSGFGLAIDLGATTKGTLNQTKIDTTIVDFVAGPRYTFHNHSRFMPYVQALFGGAYATISAPISIIADGVVTPLEPIVVPTAITARLTASHTGFAMLAGGGLDIKLGKHVAFRPFEASYYLTRIPSLLTGNITNRNNFRYSAGVNFLFGAK